MDNNLGIKVYRTETGRTLIQSPYHRNLFQITDPASVQGYPIQNVTEATLGQYIGGGGSDNVSFSQFQSSILPKIIEIKQSNDSARQSEERSRAFNSWYATQRGNKGIMEIPEQYKTALGNGDYVLKDGTLTQRSQIGQEEQYEAAVAAGTMRKVPVGQGFGYVPIGSPADLNLRQSQGGMPQGVNIFKVKEGGPYEMNNKMYNAPTKDVYYANINGVIKQITDPQSSGLDLSTIQYGSLPKNGGTSGGAVSYNTLLNEAKTTYDWNQVRAASDKINNTFGGAGLYPPGITEDAKRNIDNAANNINEIQKQINAGNKNLTGELAIWKNKLAQYQQSAIANSPEAAALLRTNPQAYLQKYGGGGADTGWAPQGGTTPQYSLGNTTLSIGSKDKNAVIELQKALNASGVGVNLKVDGVFGPATKAAVEAYQKANNLKVDGIVGQQTRGQLQGTPTPLSPADAAITEATTNNPLYNNLTPELKGLFDQLTMTISSLVEQGQRVNPDLEITPEMTARFLEQATKELDPYYQELIRQNKQDLSTSFQQLQQDYQTAVQREEPAFQKTLESQDIAEAEAGMAFSSGRQQREQDIISGQQQKLGDLFQTTQRSAEKLATAGERQIGSRAFADLGIPSLQQYAAQRSTISPRGSIASTGTRQLYAPQTGLYGELPAQSKTAISTRTSELEEAERKKRLLDYSSKFGLGASSLG